MAEAKNTFLKSKMNKDLDDRLLPSGEYRNANNVAVSKSEGQDVGALENVLGNIKIANILPDIEIEVLSSSSGSGDDIVISSFSSAASWNNNDHRVHVNYEVIVQDSVVGFVSVYSNTASGMTITVPGGGGGFSPGSFFKIRPNLKIIGALPVISTDKIYLFATNYTDVSISGLANFSSDTSNLIGANNYPGNSAILEYNLNTPTQTPAVLAEGSWLNFSKTFPILNSNLLEVLLFWTDDRNQPRKINVSTALNASFTSEQQYADGNWGYYKNEDHVSVAKYAPVTPIQLWKLYPNDGSPTYETTMKDVVSDYLPDGTTVNPDLIENYGGDPDFLEDKFVKFSYRLKFDDGEVSLMAPFTQAAYIPKQDGFFLAGDENATFRSTVVAFMENKVNNIALRIPMPYLINGDVAVSEDSNLMQCDQIEELLKVTEIEILYKESDALAVQVLDRLSLSLIETAGSSKYYEYDYQARKPYRTLPSSELIRVFDKIPPRAKTQEVISNRVVYGNYVNKLTPPDTLNYNVALSDKYSLSDNDVLEGRTSIVEYPQHTVKNNRNYQVAIILSDRYGRSSTPILSEITESIIKSGVNFGGSTFYAPYRYPNNSTSVNESSVLNWPGDSIKVLFNDVVPSVKNDLLSNGNGTGTPGIHSYNNTQSSLMIPGGWFSYKVVVRQVEQEYYNIYLPGIINGYPSHTTPYGTEVGETAFTTLFSDNINKLPRDLSEVGPEQKQYRSSVRLYGRVTNVDYTQKPYNTQYYPGREAHDPDAIGTEGELTGDLGVQSNHPSIYQSETNPYIVRLSTDSPIGQEDVSSAGTSGDINFPVLAVYETAPTVSRIDIFWETSTSGWVGKLNHLVSTSNDAPTGISDTQFAFRENQNYNGNGTGTGDADSAYITDYFQPIAQSGQAVGNGIITDFIVVDAAGANATTRFEIETTTDALGDKSFRIKLLDYFWFGNNSSTVDTFTFSFNIALDSAPADTTNINFTETLENIEPTIDVCPVFISLVPGDTDIFDFSAVNGSADPANKLNQLDFYFQTGTNPDTTALTITAADGSIFAINQSTGAVTLQSGNPSGSFQFTIIVYDASSATTALSAICVLNINFGFEEIPTAFTDAGELGPYADGVTITTNWQAENPVTKFQFFSPAGTGYTTASNLSTSNVVGTGNGLKVNIVANAGGQITSITPINLNLGTGYKPSDKITVVQAGGSGAGPFTCQFDTYADNSNSCTAGTFPNNTFAAYNNSNSCGGVVNTFEILKANQQFVVTYFIYADPSQDGLVNGDAFVPPIMQYRASPSDNYATAYDANGVPANFQGTWSDKQGSIGLVSNTNTGPTGMSVIIRTGSTDPGFQRYLMFNEPGEYRLTQASPSIASFGGYINGTCFPATGMQWDFIVRDGSYYEQVCYDPSVTKVDSVEYKVAPSSSGTVCNRPQGQPGVETVWAQAYLSKYVVEFYTDKELLTPWTPTAGLFTYEQTGTVFQGGAEVSLSTNVDEGGNKAYKAQFTTGGVKSGAAQSGTITNTV